MTEKKRRLGRGLESLLGELNTINQPEQPRARAEGELHSLPLTQITRGKYQPRKDFSNEALQELANSIRTQGVIQPIIVRATAPELYEIIAGERRFRAAKLAGLTHIPALIRQVPDEAAIAFALIENIQREDLNPLEEAEAIHRLIDEFGLTHQEAANVIGKSRVTVSNMLRLLSLEASVKALLAQGKLEMGHARALLSLSPEQQRQMADSVVLKNWSVRETEEAVRSLANPPQIQIQPIKNTELIAIEQQLLRKLNLPVQIQQNKKGKGKLVIRYKNNKEFQRLLLELCP